MRNGISRRQMGLVGLASLFGLTLTACTADLSSPVVEPSTSEHVIYLVRHAEKQAGDNPALTAEGAARAETLAGLLDDAGLTRIYSTDYKRTLETAAPIAERTGLTVELYDPRDLPGFAGSLTATPGIYLVVGHSNTTPQLTEALGGDGGTPIYEPSEYDRLYVVEVSTDGSVESRIDRFGVRFEGEEQTDSTAKQGRGS